MAKYTPSVLRRLAPYLAFVAALFLTWVSWGVTRQSFAARSGERFTRLSEQVVEAIEARVQLYISALVHTRALFEVEGPVSRTQFRDFVDAMGIEERYPGIQGIGFTVKLRPDELKVHEESVRAEGFPSYHVWPADERSEYHSIVYLEPFDWRNQRALGYDMYSDPARQKAMALARDTGKPAATDPVILVQETDVQQQIGFLIYLPLYRKGAPTQTVAERREALQGFIYSPFRSADFFMGIFGAGDVLQELQFDVFDSDDNRLLYQSLDRPKGARALHRTVNLDVGGEEWRIETFSLPGFYTGAENAISNVVLVFGLFMSFLVLGYLHYENKQRSVERRLLSKEQASRHAAEEALRVRDDFLSIASHELKTPLTGLTLQVQMLARVMQRMDIRDVQKERAERTMNSVVRQVERLSAQVDDLLDITRIRGGRFRLNPEDLELSRLVREVVARFEIELERAGYLLDIIAEDSVRGVWDRYRIEQVVVNLLTNAMKYGAGKPITIRVWGENGKAFLSVRDRGIGIAEDAQEGIFLRFERSVPTEQFVGLGLGLFIVRQIVEAHHGTIKVESRLGEGATFTVCLPSLSAHIGS